MTSTDFDNFLIGFKPPKFATFQRKSSDFLFTLLQPLFKEDVYGPTYSDLSCKKASNLLKNASPKLCNLQVIQIFFLTEPIHEFRLLNLDWNFLTFTTNW